MKKIKGAVASGHKVTTDAAEEILNDGGNAFDAIVAAHFCACVCEPVLASLAGGGYMLGKQPGKTPTVYDFFVQTPMNKQLSSNLNFYPIQADFGTVLQEFHIGLGSVAVPGSVKGMFAIHRDLCQLPMSRLLEPAIRAAKEGIHFSHLQAKIFKIVTPIYAATTESVQTYQCSDGKAFVKENDLLVQSNLAKTLEALGSEGDSFFYEGEIAKKIARLCKESGGYLTQCDLSNYQVIKRDAIKITYRNVELFTNPSPASGGLLIALALKLMEKQSIEELGFGRYLHLDLLASVMAQTNQARLDMLSSNSGGLAEHLLEETLVDNYRQQVAKTARCMRGTTHLSVIDSEGNAAAMTVSNGEGCGYIVPGTGIMLNNMLGEEDINPNGFHQWQENQRMTSMMSPSLLHLDNGTLVAMGSGGSNRIRTAMLQVISNMIDFGMTEAQAVLAPRVHFESGLLNIEPGYEAKELEQLIGNYPNHQVWKEQNLFFGGVHAVSFDGQSFQAVGDVRRDGVGRVVN